MKELTKIKKVLDKQVEFGKNLGLDLNCCTINVAVAKIEDLIDQTFWGKSLGSPSKKQIELASKFGYDISEETRRVGATVISDIMEQLNFESIDLQQLMPGDTVINKWDSLSQKQVISSIQEDGLVYFKGGNSKRAWARNLIKIEKGLS